MKNEHLEVCFLNLGGAITKIAMHEDHYNENLVLAYLRGIIDGDGHIESGYFKLVGSKEVCQYVKEVFSQWYDFKSDKKYIYEYGTIYSFEIRSKNVNNILKRIYQDATIYLDRKYEIVQKIG